MEKETLNLDLINQIIKMDGELDKDPTYKKYERIFASRRIRESIAGNFGIDPDMIPQEMVDDFMSLGEGLTEEVRKVLTPEVVVAKKDQVMELVEAIKDLSDWDEEFELSQKLKTFVDLLKQI
jgi:hypothetical protein